MNDLFINSASMIAARVNNIVDIYMNVEWFRNADMTTYMLPQEVTNYDRYD